MSAAIEQTTSAWDTPSCPPDMRVSEQPDEPCVPDMAEIPQHYENRDYWLEFQRTWFEDGIEQIAQISTYAHVDEALAIAHLSAIQSCFAISQEHKEQAVAWLASLWLQSWTRTEK